MYYLADFKLKDINVDNPLVEDNPVSVGGALKWAGGGLASGKLLDLGRRAVTHRISKHQLQNPEGLTSRQLNVYRKIYDKGGALGELKRNKEFLGGLTKIGGIGEKTKKFVGSKKGKIILGSVGALGALGGLAYKKAKDYYYL
jgi:hypothetical protein